MHCGADLRGSRSSRSPAPNHIHTRTGLMSVRTGRYKCPRGLLGSHLANRWWMGTKRRSERPHKMRIPTQPYIYAIQVIAYITVAEGNIETSESSQTISLAYRTGGRGMRRQTQREQEQQFRKLGRHTTTTAARTLELSVNLCSLEKRGKRKGCVRIVKEAQSIDKGTQNGLIMMRIIQSRRFNFSVSATRRLDSHLQR